MTLRKKYDLYANIRPAKSSTAVKTPFHDIDMVIFRENTEDLYVGIEKQVDENTIHATKVITRKASERIIRDAFDYARAHGLKKVSCIHNANILKMSDGLFLSIFQDIAREYPEIETNDKIIDNTCMQMVMNPNQFDVLVMPNLYGDLISDLASGLIGGLGLLPSSNLGKDYAMMLEYMKDFACASRIRRAVDLVLEDGSVLTPDLGGHASTEAYRDAIIAKLD